MYEQSIRNELKGESEQVIQVALYLENYFGDGEYLALLKKPAKDIIKIVEKYK